MQILLPFGAVLLVTIFGLSGLTAYLGARQAVANVEQQLQSVARVLGASAFPLNSTVLQQTHGLSGAHFIFTSSTGDIQASSGLSGIDSLADAGPSVAWQDLELGYRTTIGGESYFHNVISIGPRASSASPGLLHIFYPESVLSAAVRSAVWPAVGIGLGSLMVLSIVAITIANRVSRPVTQLRNQVERLVEGEYTPVPVPRRHDEIRHLVLSVNQMAQQLAEMQQGIQRSERLSLLGRLSGGLAHHLRNTITGARVAAQLHQLQCAGDPESMEVVLRQLQLTEEHLRRFLSVGQPQQPKREPLTLADSVREAVVLLSPSLNHKHVQLVGNQVDAELQVLADRDHLRQLLLNLLLNASEAAGSGGTVEVCSLQDGDVAVLQVWDSGAGVPESIIGRLFEPFATSKQEGIGLGLAVAKQVADAHGGTLRYNRVQGRTLFELRLPSILASATV